MFEEKEKCVTVGLSYVSDNMYCVNMPPHTPQFNDHQATHQRSSYRRFLFPAGPGKRKREKKKKIRRMFYLYQIKACTALYTIPHNT